MPRYRRMILDEAPPPIGRLRCRAIFELPRSCITRIQEPQVVARLPQRRRRIAPSIYAVHGARSDFDPPGEPAFNQAPVRECEVLRQRERTVPLPRGRQHDRVAAPGERLDDAVEVTSLGNVVEEEQDADARIL
jgi:hypothetical protein